MTKAIALANSLLVTIVDDEDFEAFGDQKWGLRLQGSYVAHDGPRGSSTVFLHRLITSAPKGVICDHVNGQTLDNRRENLRLVTQQQNVINRRRWQGHAYKGISFDAGRGTWSAKVQINGVRTWLGVFKDPVDAARAYDAAARKLFGEYARVNFPEDS